VNCDNISINQSISKRKKNIPEGGSSSCPLVRRDCDTAVWLYNRGRDGDMLRCFCSRPTSTWSLSTRKSANCDKISFNQLISKRKKDIPEGGSSSCPLVRALVRRHCDTAVWLYNRGRDGETYSGASAVVLLSRIMGFKIPESFKMQFFKRSPQQIS
jgi:hypothetical protein